MNDRLALRRSCLDSPLNRLPRLVLADWYADHPDFVGSAANEMFLDPDTAA